MNKILKKCYLWITLKLLYPWQYGRFVKQPLKENKVVFIEANLSKLSQSMSYLYGVMQKNGDYELKVHYLQEAFTGKGTYIKNVLNCLKDAATAGTIVLCEASRPVSCIKKRQGTKVIQLWHGCGAFKKFGMSTAALKFGGGRDEYLKYPYYKNYDCVTISSPQVAWAYEEAMSYEKESPVIQPIGISRTDVFFQDEFKEAAYKELYEKIPEAEGKKVILYAPTFRGSVGQAVSPACLDVAAMAETLSDEYLLLIKHHPVVQSPPDLCGDWNGKFAVDVTEQMEIDVLLCVSDICVTDYSSLIFEYSLFERPVFFFAYDLEEYGDWRGFYYDYEELTPGPIVRNTGQLIDGIHELKLGFKKEQVQAFKEKFMSACDGYATERLLNQVIKKRE